MVTARARRCVAGMLALGVLAAGCGSTVQFPDGTSAAPVTDADALGSPVPRAHGRAGPGRAGPAAAGTAPVDGAGAVVPPPPATGPAREGPRAPTAPAGPAASAPPVASDPTGPTDEGDGGGDDVTDAGPPPTGPGWDEEKVYIGVPYQESSSSQAALDAMGLQGVVLIDMKAVAQAVIDDVNRRGGLLGRELVPVFANFPAVPNQSGQAQCATWTQDNRVFAVADTFLNTDTIYGCLAKAQVPFNNANLGPVNNAVFRQYAPYFRKLNVAGADTMYPTFVERLSALEFFTRWNTVTGAPGGPAPVKLGLLCDEAKPATTQNCELLTRLLETAGHDVAATFHYIGSESPTQMSNAVLQFRDAGVTHVFPDTVDVLFFMQNAEHQGYRPRYALTSLNVPLLLEANVPPRQLVGSLGVGWLPAVDVNPGDAPHLGDGQEHCRKVMRDANQNSSGTGEAQAQSICDGIYLFEHAVKHGGGLSASHVVAGMGPVASTFRSASVFEVGFSETRYDEAAAVRDLGWNTGCRCFQYLDTTNHPS